MGDAFHIFTRAIDGQRLYSAHLQPGGVPPPKKKFKCEHLKFGFKFSVDTRKTLGLVGVTS